MFVETVTGFVEDPEEGGGEVVFVVTGSEAHILRAEGGAKGMSGGVDASAGEVEADGLGDFAIEDLLLSDGSGT